jgi:hypothetical protein
MNSRNIFVAAAKYTARDRPDEETAWHCSSTVTYRGSSVSEVLMSFSMRVRNESGEKMLMFTSDYVFVSVPVCVCVWEESALALPGLDAPAPASTSIASPAEVGEVRDKSAAEALLHPAERMHLNIFTQYTVSSALQMAFPREHALAPAAYIGMSTLETSVWSNAAELACAGRFDLASLFTSFNALEVLLLSVEAGDAGNATSAGILKTR